MRPASSISLFKGHGLVLGSRQHERRHGDSGRDGGESPATSLRMPVPHMLHDVSAHGVAGVGRLLDATATSQSAHASIEKLTGGPGCAMPTALPIPSHILGDISEPCAHITCIRN